MKKTSINLADGRELIYFDELDDSVRAAIDTRTLPPPPAVSQLRYDALMDEWITIAGHRQTRTFLPPSQECPLCPSTPERATEIPAYDYDVVVFENRFPSLSHPAGRLTGGLAGGPPGGPAGSLPGGPSGGGTPDGEAPGKASGGGTPDGEAPGKASGGGAPGGGSDDQPYPMPVGDTWPTSLTPVRPAFGRCEVVCFTKEHNASFAALTPERVRTVIDALADRTTALGELPEVEQVFCFENRGEEIGVTLHHPHGQIYAYPFVTPRTRTMLTAARRYADRTGGRNLYADVLAAERDAGDRVIGGNEHWTAFVPAAARWPFEVHVAPHRHVLDLPGLTPAEVDAFAPLYLDVLRRLDGLFGVPMPYISGWFQAPIHHPDRNLAYLHLELFSIRRAPGKLKYLAGSESAMGVFVNDVLPEDAARMLREAPADTSERPGRGARP